MTYFINFLIVLFDCDSHCEILHVGKLRNVNFLKFCQLLLKGRLCFF